MKAKEIFENAIALAASANYDEEKSISVFKKSVALYTKAKVKIKSLEDDILIGDEHYAPLSYYAASKICYFAGEPTLGSLYSEQSKILRELLG